MTIDQVITALNDQIQDKKTFLHGDGDGDDADSQFAYDIEALQTAIALLNEHIRLGKSTIRIAARKGFTQVEADRLELVTLLAKAGYTVQIKRENTNGAGKPAKYEYVVEAR
jgi:hypothetical protein